MEELIRCETTGQMAGKTPTGIQPTLTLFVRVYQGCTRGSFCRFLPPASSSSSSVKPSPSVFSHPHLLALPDPPVNTQVISPFYLRKDSSLFSVEWNRRTLRSGRRLGRDPPPPTPPS